MLIYDIFVQMKHNLLMLLTGLLSFCSMQLVAQDETEADNNEISFKGAKGFHVGFYIGAFFPNKKSTVVYDGYGYDGYGNKNDFTSSFMYRKIVQENDPNKIGRAHV